MPRLVFSERFANDLAAVTSSRIEKRILLCLDNIERFPEFGSSQLPTSIASQFGANVRKVSIRPFDLIYTYDKERELVLVEALVYQRAAW